MGSECVLQFYNYKKSRDVRQVLLQESKTNNKKYVQESFRSRVKNWAFPYHENRLKTCMFSLMSSAANEFLSEK